MRRASSAAVGGRIAMTVMTDIKATKTKRWMYSHCVFVKVKLVLHRLVNND